MVKQGDYYVAKQNINDLEKIEEIITLYDFKGDSQMTYLKMSKVSDKLFLTGYKTKKIWVLDGAESGQLRVLQIHENDELNDKRILFITDSSFSAL